MPGERRINAERAPKHVASDRKRFGLALSASVCFAHLGLCIVFPFVCLAGRRCAFFWETAFGWPGMPAPFIFLCNVCGELLKWSWAVVPLGVVLIGIEGTCLYRLTHRGRVVASVCVATIGTTLLAAVLASAIWSMGLPAVEARKILLRERKVELPGRSNGQMGPERSEGPWGAGAFPPE